jgi:hypothetical protein
MYNLSFCQALEQLLKSENRFLQGVKLLYDQFASIVIIVLLCHEGENFWEMRPRRMFAFLKNWSM